MRGAIGTATVFRRVAAGLPRAALAGGLAFYPVVGLGLGAVAALVASAVGTLVPALAGAAGVLALAALTGPREPWGLAVAVEALVRPGSAADVVARLRARPGLLGAAIAAGAVGVRLWAATVLPPPARTTALLFAPLIGAWAIVVQCYGGAPLRARGTAAALVGRARFREFGWASLVTFAVVLAIADALGLLLLLVAALTTVGVRLWVHRRAGGLTGRALAATRELVQTVVLLVLALLAG